MSSRILQINYVDVDVKVSFKYFVYIFKEIAASVLSVISFPAFAVEDADLVHLTRSVIVERLEVEYEEKSLSPLPFGFPFKLNVKSRFLYLSAKQCICFKYILTSITCMVTVYLSCIGSVWMQKIPKRWLYDSIRGNTYWGICSFHLFVLFSSFYLNTNGFFLKSLCFAKIPRNLIDYIMNQLS